MTTLLRSTLALITVILLAACGFTKAKTVAEKAVNTFHQQYNGNEFTEIYSATAPDFKNSASEAEYMNFIQTIRSKMGVFKSSSQSSWRANATTNGTFVVLRYKSEFEHSAGTEDFIFVVSGGSAKLVRIDVNSPLLPPS